MDEHKQAEGTEAIDREGDGTIDVQEDKYSMKGNKDNEKDRDIKEYADEMPEAVFEMHGLTGCQKEKYMADQNEDKDGKQAKVEMLKARLDLYRRRKHQATHNEGSTSGLAEHWRAERDSDCGQQKIQSRTTKIQNPPVFLELFAGEGMLTRVVGRQAATFKQHEQGEMDLLNPTNQRRLRAMVRRQEVRWLHCAPPRKTFTRVKRRDKMGVGEGAEID